jgi:hypothetical protein
LLMIVVGAKLVIEFHSLHSMDGCVLWVPTFDPSGHPK